MPRKGTSPGKAGRPTTRAQAGGDDGASARDSAVLAATLDPVITIDVRGKILSASKSISRVLGWSPSEVIGQNVSILMPEPHRSAHDGYLTHYMQTGRTNILNRPRRFEAVRKDGSLVPIELCVSRAEVPGGAHPLFVGIIRDMSEYVAAERSHEEERIRSQQLLAEQTSALQTAHLRLRMADRMASIGTLAAGLGHDMNNVLLPVRARLNALRAAGAAGKLPPSERKHVEEVRKSVTYLQQLADGLHYLAMDPDADQTGAATDLREWWSQAGALLSKAVPKHVRVSTSIPPGLPPVHVAAHGLTQAVLNLVVNAGEAIPGPGVRKRRQGHVRIAAERAAGPNGQGVRLSVSDNGTGMTEEVKRRAFEMFFTTKPRGLGTGLGLALVRNVVDRAGGRVEIDSEPGKGTTVSLVLPTAVSGPGLGERAAAVTVQNGRAAALIRHVLEVSGVAVQPGPSPRVDVWVVEPRESVRASVAAWKSERPGGRLVLFGTPEKVSDWSAYRPLVINNPDDFESVRRTLARAIAPS